MHWMLHLVQTYSYGTDCGLRIVFNEAELSQYTYEQSGLNLSFSALYDGKDKYLDPYVWGNASLNFEEKLILDMLVCGFQMSSVLSSTESRIWE